LGGARIDVDAVQVVRQDAVGDGGGLQLRLLLAVHRHQHVEGLAQEVPAAHAGIEDGQAIQRGEGRRVEPFRADVILPRVG